jgi:hypothetical protein
MNLGGFSLKRLLGITRAKREISREIGVPLTRSGRERKAGALLRWAFFGRSRPSRRYGIW